MFTGVAQKNRAAAEVYFDEHLTHNDYYSQGEIRPGEWIGQGSSLLGLKEGEHVERKNYNALCDNLHPQTGESLTMRRNSEGQRRIYFDFTCSAPKSVSIMAVTMDDKRIVEAHETAAKIALRELEQFAATRIRKNGADEDRTTGRLAGAAFTHSSSRSLDPQLHTHFVLFNCTYDSTEMRWKALQSSGMFDACNYGTEVYRNELSRRLQEMGYEVCKASNGFEIKGVSKEIQRRFSKRSSQRDAMVAKLEKELGRKLSNNEVSHAIHRTRSKKLKGISAEEVRKRQLAQIGFIEKMSLDAVRRSANGVPKCVAEKVTEKEALSYAKDHVFERSSVVGEHDLLQAALQKGRGQIRLAPLKEELRSSRELFRVGNELSTREILETELYLIRSMNDGKDSIRPINPRYVAAKSLGEDQQKAIELILKSADLFTGIRGLAGTGKTTALRELSKGITQTGYRAVFCAPTSAATDVLRRDGFDAVTMQSLLADPKTQQKLDQQSVIVLDEAGLVGIDDMRRLFEIALKTRCRIVFSGDVGQHSSVPRGDALRILEQHSRYSFGELTQIRRQNRADYLRVVELAAIKQTKAAFDQLERMDAIHEVNSAKDGSKGLYESATLAYLQSVKAGKSALLVSPTWKEIDALTGHVREKLKADGSLGHSEHSLTVLDSLALTKAQMRDAQEFEKGQRVVFYQKLGQFSKNEVVEVIATQTKKLRVKRTDNTEHSLDLAKLHSSIGVYKTRQLPIAIGDKLLLQANRGKEFINGELVTVSSIEGQNIVLSDGRALPPDYRQFCHGYAVTSHSAQGRNVQDVFLVASSLSFGAVNREQFYVSISRGRENCMVFTDDKVSLREKITRTQERTSAVELVEFREALKKKGFQPKTPRAFENPVELVTQVSKQFHGLSKLRPLRLTTNSRISIVQWLFQLAEKFRRRKAQSIRPDSKLQSTDRTNPGDRPLRHRGISI